MPKKNASPDASIWKELNERFAKVISEIDERAAKAAVEAMRKAFPEETTEQIIERLIRDKCLKTAGIGAASAAAAILPGLGTAASLTVGLAADIGATFKLQAELVLEIAAAHDRKLTETEKRTAVMVITGISSGANQALKAASAKLIAQYAEKWVAHALPVVGVGASAALNALTTYVVGQRANAYFALGPNAIVDLPQTLMALTGIDLDAVGAWIAASSASSWELASTGASATISYIGITATATGSAIVSGASAAGDVVASGASASADAFVYGVSAAANYVTESVSTVGSASRWTADTLASYAKGGVGAVGSAGKWASSGVVDGVSAVKRRIWSSHNTEEQSGNLQDDTSSVHDPYSPDADIAQ